MAEANAHRYIHQFATGLYKQMGVRLFVLASYFDTGDTLRVGVSSNCPLWFSFTYPFLVSLDFNKECGDGKSFKQSAKSWWDKANPEARYAEFSRATRGVGADGQEVPNEPFTLQQNEFGEPQIPDPTRVPQGLTPTVFYKETIRQFLTIHYGASIQRSDHC